MYRSGFLSLLLALFVCTTATGQESRQPIDRVVAVINDEIILQSEVDMQAQYFAYSNRLYSVSNDLWNDVLKNLVSSKILLAKAKLDSIRVPASQIDAELDQRIDYLISRLGSETAVRDYYGKSILQIRNELRESVQKERMVNTIKQKEFGSLSITRPEVEEFYQQHLDSMPVIPASADLYQIFILPDQTDEAKQKAVQKITAIRDSIKNGIPFADLAKRHGEDGTAARGGELGFFKRGELVPEFEEAAYKLEPGQMSDVVETEFGYHLIQMIERRGETINTRHILIRADRASLDHDAAVKKLSGWREDILAGRETFQNLATIYSKDEFARKGGYLGKIPMTDLTPPQLAIVNSLEAGSISQPAQISTESGQVGYHIVWVKSKLPEHRMNLELDFEELSSIALEKKRNDAFETWLEKAKSGIFIEVKYLPETAELE